MLVGQINHNDQLLWTSRANSRARSSLYQRFQWLLSVYDFSMNPLWRLSAWGPQSQTFGNFPREFWGTKGKVDKLFEFDGVFGERFILFAHGRRYGKKKTLGVSNKDSYIGFRLENMHYQLYSTSTFNSIILKLFFSMKYQAIIGKN